MFSISVRKANRFFEQTNGLVGAAKLHQSVSLVVASGSRVWTEVQQCLCLSKGRIGKPSGLKRSQEAASQ